jgi:hypothetical protein
MQMQRRRLSTGEMKARFRRRSDARALMLRQSKTVKHYHPSNVSQRLHQCTSTHGCACNRQQETRADAAEWRAILACWPRSGKVGRMNLEPSQPPSAADLHARMGGTEVYAIDGPTAYRNLGLTVSVHTQMHGTSLPIVGTVLVAGFRWFDGYDRTPFHPSQAKRPDWNIFMPKAIFSMRLYDPRLDLSLFCFAFDTTPLTFVTQVP